METKKKKLLKIGGLAATLLLLGGTFAFTNFGQRALNLTEGDNRPKHGGRLHDYFHDGEEGSGGENNNKDVFAENFGENPLFVRVKFTELMTRNGVPMTSTNVNDPSASDAASLVPAGFKPEDPLTWPTWKIRPSSEDNALDAAEQRRPEVGAGEAHPWDEYFRLNFGQSANGDNRPWYMPTFNLDPNSYRTATAGVGIDMDKEQATHPGDGTANYWDRDGVATSIMPSEPNESLEQHTTRQVLSSERPPITYSRWETLDHPVGNFWIVDEATGWAYWADLLESGEATSFLLDSKAPQSGRDEIKTEWAYELHVIGEFAGTGTITESDPLQGEPYTERFWHPDYGDPTSEAHGSVIIEAINNAHP